MSVSLASFSHRHTNVGHRRSGPAARAGRPPQHRRRQSWPAWTPLEASSRGSCRICPCRCHTPGRPSDSCRVAPTSGKGHRTASIRTSGSRQSGWPRGGRGRTGPVLARGVATQGIDVVDQRTGHGLVEVAGPVQVPLAILVSPGDGEGPIDWCPGGGTASRSRSSTACSSARKGAAAGGACHHITAPPAATPNTRARKARKPWRVVATGSGCSGTTVVETGQPAAPLSAVALCDRRERARLNITCGGRLSDCGHTIGWVRIQHG